MASGGPTFLEFFAGGGMARAGLGEGWACAFANDFDPSKADAYAAAWGERPVVADIHTLSAGDLHGPATLAWASSPCQDFSLAGTRAGLAGERSSALLGFVRLMQALAAEGRAPAMIVVENVVGMLTASGGADFAALCAALVAAGYRVGALELDAGAFIPQSRPRVFVVACRTAPPAALQGEGHGVTRAVREAHAALPAPVREAWVWWRLPTPPRRNADLASVLLPGVEARCWWSPAKTDALVGSMAPLHRTRLEQMLARPGRSVAAAYRRTRRGVPTAEVRFDGLAGCLRTPAGGSSRQIVLVAENDALRARWLAPREAARLMGLPDDYPLPAGSTAALKLLGDGVAVPVVSHLAQHILEPLAGFRNPDSACGDRAARRD